MVACRNRTGGVAAIVVVIFMCHTALGIQPPDGAVLSRTEVKLDWDATNEDWTQEVQIGRDKGIGDPFQDPVLSIQVQASDYIVKEGLEFGYAYRWRFRDIVNGIPGDWSPDVGFSIRPIPINFDLEVEVVFGEVSAQPGITIFNHCDSIVGFDLDGELVLLVDTPAHVSDFRVIEDGRLLFVGGGRAWIISLDGDEIWASPDDDDFKVHHSTSMMPSGNVLMVVREYRDIKQDGVVRNWQGDRIVEMDPVTNQITWEWSTFDHYTTDDYDVYQTNHWNDWTHVNDAHYVEADNSVYISSRHLSRITRIDYDTGQIIYNMGMDMPSGDVPFGDDLFSYQHSPDVLPNGNMMVFDNGNRRGGKSEGENAYTLAVELAFTGSPPVAAEIVWSWQTPVYCPSTGDANRLDNGNTLITATQLSGIYEVAPEGDTAWELAIVNNEACPGLRPGYRAIRVPGLFLEDVEISCMGDLNGDNLVGVDDLLALLAQWDSSGKADLDGNGVVEVNDVLIMLKRWGPCGS